MQTLQAHMEQASRSLAARDYAAAERGCLLALAQAREASAWGDYARILMPLQECRRQRRMIASDAAVRLGTTDLAVALTLARISHQRQA